VSIDDLIESIGLPAHALRPYVVDELDEFLEATTLGDQIEELGDVVFALHAMAWAHTGRHLPLTMEGFGPKVRSRLRRYGALTRREPTYLHDRLPELQYGVVHLAFGHFTGQWTEFDPLKNGTVAEIHLLTEIPVFEPDGLANHVIVTFDETESIEYAIIDGASDTAGGNIVLCRIPQFLFRQAKRTLRFVELADFLSLQVLAALDGLRLDQRAIVHVHSWEGAFLLASSEFRSRMEGRRTIFSPYLTVGPLKEFVERAPGADGWTMPVAELEIAARQERELASWASTVVLESSRDLPFYEAYVPPDRLQVRSFAIERSAAYPSGPPDRRVLSFIAGGRPVREKGFVELCEEFTLIHEWARERDIQVKLEILCRERRPDKGAAYLAEVGRTIADHGLQDVVSLDLKVSLPQLRRRMEGASAVIVPSLFDPYGLMATYAVEVSRPAFVSRHAGVAENLEESTFTFDPLVRGDLLRAIERWHGDPPLFRFSSVHPSYRDLYLAR
jgi:hypothetical protein